MPIHLTSSPRKTALNLGRALIAAGLLISSAFLAGCGHSNTAAAPPPTAHSQVAPPPTPAQQEKTKQRNQQFVNQAAQMRQQR